MQSYKGEIIMTRECPSCGAMVEEGQLFCPMCGTKMPTANIVNKNENKYLKDEIAKAEAYATAVLYSKSKIVFNEVNAAELNFLNIIEKFPSEPKAYVAYVNFATKYVDRVMNPRAGDDFVYFRDMAGYIEKSKQYLSKALSYSNDDIDGSLLQEISVLQSKLESYKLDKSIEEKNENKIKQNKKATIWGGIFIGLMILGFICWLLNYL